MFFAANGARFGFAKTLSANFGYHLATIIVTFLIGFGFNIFFSFINDQYQVHSDNWIIICNLSCL